MLECCRLEEGGTGSHALAGGTAENSVPVSYLIFLAGSTFSGPSPFSVLECQCSTLRLFYSLGHRLLPTAAYSFCVLIALAALCL